MRCALASALFAALVSAQTVTVYSDDACANLVTTYACSDIYNTCTNMPQGIFSYEVTDDGGQGCDAPTSVFNTFVFFSTSDTSQCGEGTENGGGGEAGCAPNGCLIVYNDQLELPAAASLSIVCQDDFNGNPRK